MRFARRLQGVVWMWCWTILGGSGGECAGGDCEEGAVPSEFADSVCADWRERGEDDFVGGSDAAEFGGGVAGKRVWERFGGADFVAIREFLKEAAKRRFEMDIKAVPLRMLRRCGGGGAGTRLVFRP